MDGWERLMEGVNNNEQLYKVINNIRDKVMNIVDAGKGTLQDDSGFDVVIESGRQVDIWVKFMSPQGMFDNVMADKFEKYLKVNHVTYERYDDRKFFIDAYDFKYLFRED